MRELTKSESVVWTTLSNKINCSTLRYLLKVDRDESRTRSIGNWILTSSYDNANYTWLVEMIYVGQNWQEQKPLAHYLTVNGQERTDILVNADECLIHCDIINRDVLRSK